MASAVTSQKEQMVKRSLLALKPGVGALDPVAQHQAILGQVVGDGQHGDHQRKQVRVVDQCETWRTPSKYARGIWQDQRIARPKIGVTMIAAVNPASRAKAPRRTGGLSRLSMPSAMPMMALYSGPTTITPTMRICELVRMPTAPMSPAIASRM
jgi:hypothetical protein